MRQLPRRHYRHSTLYGFSSRGTLADITKVCSLWQGKISCTRKELQSLLGRLLNISKCVKASRFFLNRMLEVLQNMGEEKFTELNLDFFQDLNWFSKFLTKFNGTAFFDHRPIKASVELDACLTGMGGCWNSQVYSVPIERNYKNFTIVHLEMLNLLVAMRLWADHWSSQKVVLFCDNQAVISVLNNGRTNDRTLTAIARNIQMIAAIKDINLNVVHILGKNNTVADLLSRWDITPDNYQKLTNLLPSFAFIHTPRNILDIDWSI